MLLQVFNSKFSSSVRADLPYLLSRFSLVNDLELARIDTSMILVGQGHMLRDTFTYVARTSLFWSYGNPNRLRMLSRGSRSSAARPGPSP